MNKFVFVIIAIVLSFCFNPDFLIRIAANEKINVLLCFPKDTVPGNKRISALPPKSSAKEGDQIIDKIFSLPEVKAKNKFIDSLTNHKHGVAVIIMKRPDQREKYYWVQAGYNNEIRFEPFYNFYVYPPNQEIKFMDTMTDEILSLDEWRKKEKR